MSQEKDLPACGGAWMVRGMAGDLGSSAWWRFRKDAGAWLVSHLVDPPAPAGIALERPLRVGYLRFDKRVGEVLLQTPLFHAHKKARPQDTVVAVVHPKMARLLEGQPGVDAVVPFAWRGWPVQEGAWELLERLAALKLDVAVDCSDPSRFSVGHALATRATGAPVRLGFQRGPAEHHFTHPVEVPVPLHEATARARLLLPLGVHGDAALHWAPRHGTQVLVDGQDVVALMAAEPGRHAVVCPGGRLEWRRGRAAWFGALCRTLKEAGRTPWLAPGPGEDALCAEVAALCPGARMLPQTSFDALGALMQAAGVTVCNNTGTMHLSTAVGAATFALFVGMDPVRWGHHQAKHRMVVARLEDAEEEARLCAALRAWLAAS